MNIPIVTLDKIYIIPDNQNIFFLDCTRVNGTNEIKPRIMEPIDIQIRNIKKNLNCNKVILADDVVFSGNVLKLIINKFKSEGLEVVGIITSICTQLGYEYFSKNLKYGIKSNYIMSYDVIDQICERDFYFGIAGSGIIVKEKNEFAKAPYFFPYGNPNERASIPKDREIDFSIGCLERSVELWDEIDKLSKEKTIISELPEKIVRTNEKDEVVKTLKKEIKSI